MSWFLFCCETVVTYFVYLLAGLCRLNPFHLAMAEQHKTFANALKNLKGIHRARSSKGPSKDKGVVAEAEVPPISVLATGPGEEESGPIS